MDTNNMLETQQKYIASLETKITSLEAENNHLKSIKPNHEMVEYFNSLQQDYSERLAEVKALRRQYQSAILAAQASKESYETKLKSMIENLRNTAVTV